MHRPSTGSLALWHSWHWTLHSPPVSLGLGPVRLSVGAAEINDKVDLRAVGNCVQVNRNRRVGGGTFRWAGPFAYRNDLLANDKCG